MKTLHVCDNKIPIQAYEAVHHGAINGVIYRANGLTSEVLTANFTCYSRTIALGLWAPNVHLLLHSRVLDCYAKLIFSRYHW